MRMLAESGSGDILLPGTQVARFTVTSHGSRTRELTGVSFIGQLIPITRALSPKSRLLAPSHLGIRILTYQF